MNPIKVAIVDDHKLLCSGLERIINSFDGMVVINNSHSGIHFLRFLSTAEVFPDVVLLDIAMPEMNGEEALAIITRDYPSIKVIMISFHNEIPYILKMIEKGAVGYLTKSETHLELEQTIREVHTIGEYFTNEVKQFMMDKKNNIKLASTHKNAKKALPPTPCEIKVLELICHQKTAIEIANELDVSVRTVENHRASLLKKAKVKNSIGLVLYAISHKLFKMRSTLE